MPLCSMFGPSSAYLNAYMQKTVKSDHSRQHATLLINLQGLENKLIKIVCTVVYSRLHIVSFQIVSFHKTSLKYESEKITKIQKIHQRENNFVCFIFETGIQLLWSTMHKLWTFRDMQIFNLWSSGLSFSSEQTD